VTTQDARTRRRLGAEIAQRREAAGFPKQPDLAKAAGLGLRTVVAFENGEKVSAKTYTKIETAMRLPVGSLNDYLEHGTPLPSLPDSAVDAAVPPRREATAEEEAKMRAMTMREGLEFGQKLAETSELAALLWTQEFLRLKAEDTVRSPRA